MYYIMRLYIIIATVVVYTHAAPTSELQHPSPVNPDILVAVKPKETITLITDPEETIKFKRETKQPFYPTVLPKENEHRITIRDNKPGQVTKSKTLEAPVDARKPHQKSQNRNKPILNNRNRRNVESYQKPTTTDGFKKQPSLPRILKSTTTETDRHKRDIPVPSVPKHKHPEESPKDNNEEETTGVHSDHAPQTQVHEEHNSKVEQQKQQYLPTNSKETKDLLQQQKRETSMSSVSCRESLKEIEPHKENKETKSENHKYECQTLGLEYVTTEKRDVQHHDKEELQKSQIPSAQNPAALSVPHELAQKTKTKEALKKSPEYTYHQQHVIRGADEFPKQTDVDRKEVNNKSTEEHPNKHDVEDLLVSKSSHKPMQHTAPIHKDLKPNVLGDRSSVRDFTISTTEHPIIRRQPVPVSELFSRPHGN